MGLDQVLQQSHLQQRLGRLQRGQKQTTSVSIYQGWDGRNHLVLQEGQQYRVTPARVLTRGALVVGEPVSFVQGFLDGISGD